MARFEEASCGRLRGRVQIVERGGVGGRGARRRRQENPVNALRSAILVAAILAATACTAHHGDRNSRAHN